jgi:hypothetical protein
LEAAVSLLGLATPLVFSKVSAKKIGGWANLLDSTPLGFNFSAHDLRNASLSELKELGFANGSALFLGLRQLLKEHQWAKKRIRQPRGRCFGHKELADSVFDFCRHGILP